MKQLKYGLISLLSLLGVAIMPATVSAAKVTNGMKCSVNNYGNYSCTRQQEVTVRKRTISYVEENTKVTNLKFLDTAMSTQTKLVLGSVLALGLLGVAVKFTRFAK